MAEHHEIVGPARGEPRPAGSVGARVRVPLEAAPSPQWSDVLTAHLTCALTGHPAVGHLRLKGVVQGSDIVLEGVETPEAALLGPVLREAIEAANGSCARAESGAGEPVNMERAEAEEIARAVTASGS